VSGFHPRYGRNVTISKQIALKCRCGAESVLSAWDTVNVTDHPELKSALIEGRLWTHTCPSCGVEAPVPFQMLYQDMCLPGGPPGASLLILLSFDEDFDPTELDAGTSDEQFLARMGAQTTRLVRSHNALIEKIHIAESGLDDRSLEVLKAVVRKQVPSMQEPELLFNGREADGAIRMVALTPEGPRGVTIPLEEYERIHGMLSGLYGALTFVRWAEVDRQFGEQVLGKLG